MDKGLVICLVVCVFLGMLKQPDNEVLQKASTGGTFFKIRLKGDENDEHALIVLLRRSGDKVELLDPATQATLKGEVVQTDPSESVVLFEFSDEWKNLRTWQGFPARGLEFQRRKTDNRFTARLTGPPDSPELVVELLLSVWACSNHNNPTHTADSQEQMTELTAKNGCTGWHKLEPSAAK